METVHNVINLCALFDVGVDATCASNAVHKVPIVETNANARVYACVPLSLWLPWWRQRHLTACRTCLRRPRECFNNFQNFGLPMTFLAVASQNLFALLPVGIFDAKGKFFDTETEFLDHSRPISQECLDENLLALSNGTTRVFQPPGVGFFTWEFQLPPGVECSQCVIQWKWNTGASAMQNRKMVCHVTCVSSALQICNYIKVMTFRGGFHVCSKFWNCQCEVTELLCTNPGASRNKTP